MNTVASSCVPIYKGEGTAEYAEHAEEPENFRVFRVFRGF